jgi:hypothetical protein
MLAQAVHSFEEYSGRLWESFPPAASLAGLFSPHQEFAFVILNALLVTFGFWCLFWPVRRGWPSAPTLVWGWVALETINAIGHSAWSMRQGAYTPGVLTTPILLALAVYLGIQLLQRPFSRGSN